MGCQGGRALESQPGGEGNDGCPQHDSWGCICDGCLLSGEVGCSDPPNGGDGDFGGTLAEDDLLQTVGLSSNSSAADLGVKVTREYFLQDLSWRRVSRQDEEEMDQSMLKTFEQIL